MAIPQRSDAGDITILQGDEARAYFDAEAHELVGMSGEEFLRRLDSGEWDEVIDEPEYRDHLFLASMRSFAG